MTDTSGTASGTRDMLIDAAPYLFGTKVASIAWYFGGKAGPPVPGLHAILCHRPARRVRRCEADRLRADWLKRWDQTPGSYHG